MYIAFAIHCIIVLSFAIDGDPIRNQVALFCTIPLAINLVGLLLTLVTNKTLLGAKLFKYTCFIFIPIGVIGILGANKLIESVNKP